MAQCNQLTLLPFKGFNYAFTALYLWVLPSFLILDDKTYWLPFL